MATAQEIVVRGRCACGRRYRVRHAQPDMVVQCPNCRRPITITEADIRAAGAQTGLSLQPLQDEIKEAILLDRGELKPAPREAQIGLTGRTVGPHDESLLSEALYPGLRRCNPLSDDPSNENEAPARLFLSDLFSGFFFVGDTKTALVVLATGLWCALMLSAALLVSSWPLYGFPANIVLVGIASVLAIRFFWFTLFTSAIGESQLPLVEANWDWLDDAVIPTLWTLLVTALCAMPATLAWWLVPQGAHRTTWVLAAAGIGSFLWPAGMMSVAIGQSLWFLRPDWLLRCIVAIGPVYLVAWLVVAAGAGLLAYLWHKGPGLVSGGWVAVGFSVLSACLAATYAGFLVFRTCGLLYHHYRHRFSRRF